MIQAVVRVVVQIQTVILQVQKTIMVRRNAHLYLHHYPLNHNLSHVLVSNAVLDHGILHNTLPNHNLNHVLILDVILYHVILHNVVIDHVIKEMYD